MLEFDLRVRSIPSFDRAYAANWHTSCKITMKYGIALYSVADILTEYLLTLTRSMQDAVMVATVPSDYFRRYLII